MNILFNVYPIAFDCPGGGEVQLLKTKQAIEQLGENVRLFDQWNPQLDWPNIVHYFSVFGGSDVFCNYIKHKRLPLAISPILWPRGDTSGYPMAMIKHLLNIADILFPNSVAETHALAEIFDVPIEKFHVTHNGIDSIFLEDRQPSPDVFRRHTGITGPFALCVGNIEARKNQIRLAEAAARLKLPTILLGNIRDRAYYESALKAGQGYVRYEGFIQHHCELLRSAYKACEVFVLPSTLETPGLAALEAAALGAKIVITREGCAQEYFGAEADYVDPLDVESIMYGVEQSLQRKNDNLLSINVRQFTWQRTAQETLAGYRKLV
jgi:glycosyltransferase involved in cell wall biosynthesis